MITQTADHVTDKRVEFAYYEDGQFHTITQRNGTLVTDDVVAQSTYDYDNIGRLFTLLHEDGDATPDPLANYSWTYDAAGRIQGMHVDDDNNSGNGDDSLDYDYDATHQVIDTTYSPGWLDHEQYDYFCPIPYLFSRVRRHRRSRRVYVLAREARSSLDCKLRSSLVLRWQYGWFWQGFLKERKVPNEALGWS